MTVVIYQYLIILIAYYVTISLAFQQELIWHEDVDLKGNYFVFRQNIPDTSKYFIQNVRKLCVRGSGAMYSTSNYSKFSTRFNSNGPNLFCVNWDYVKTPVLSFRFGGCPNDTTTNTLNLYSGPLYEGDEISISGLNLTTKNISLPVRSLMSTGMANWTLFENSDLTGKSICWVGSSKPIYRDDVQTLGIFTVGSVSMGCH